MAPIKLRYNVKVKTLLEHCFITNKQQGNMKV